MMTKSTQNYGFDVDSVYIVAAVPNSSESYEIQKFKNTAKGITNFIQKMPANSTCVVELTGSYSMLLCYMLEDAGMLLYTVNPYCLKRFKEARRAIRKCDPSDAINIAECLEPLALDRFQPKSEAQEILSQRIKLLNLYIKEQTAYSNRLKSFSYKVYKDQVVQQSYENRLAQLSQDIADLEELIRTQTDELYEEKRALLRSVVGIGPKTAALILLLTDGFSNFTNHKKFARYLGLVPYMSSSGKQKPYSRGLIATSVPWARAKIYAACRSAIRFNPACKALYERLRAKGRKHKQAMIAVANKLLKIAFAVVLSGKPYDKQYQRI